MEQLLIGAFCHLDGEDPEDDTFEQVERTLSEYYEICNGPEPNSCRINFAGNTESEDAPWTDVPELLVEQFLPLLDGDYVLVSYVNLNSKRGVLAVRTFIPSREVKARRLLTITSRPKSSDALCTEMQSLCVDSLTRRSLRGESRYTRDMFRRARPLPSGDR